MSNAFKVYKVRNNLPIQDPDISGTRYHTVIFVETERNGDGWIHHVVGDLVTGMAYERREEQRPEESLEYHDKEFLGFVDADTYPECIVDVCNSYPAPEPQKAFNTATSRTEPMKPDGTFYDVGESRRPLKKCTEWIEQDVIPALIKQGVLIGK